MKRTLYTFCLLISMACNQSKIDPSGSTSGSNTQTKQDLSIKGLNVLNPAHGKPGHNCAIPVGTPLKNSVQTNTPQWALNPQTVNTIAPEHKQPPAGNPGIKLNPAHGQPGHNCAIPVGAPLNSAQTPGQGTNNRTQKQIQAKSIITTALNINPPHGQHGHNCAVPVGAPLNGAATTMSPKTDLKPVALKADSATQASPLTNEVKLNPKHGMPGHNCAIPVGAPLS